MKPKEKHANEPDNKNHPFLLKEDQDLHQLWMWQDDNFKLPKVSCNITFYSNDLNLTTNHQSILFCQLWNKILVFKLKSFLY